MVASSLFDIPMMMTWFHIIFFSFLHFCYYTIYMCCVCVICIAYSANVLYEFNFRFAHYDAVGRERYLHQRMYYIKYEKMQLWQKIYYYYGFNQNYCCFTFIHLSWFVNLQPTLNKMYRNTQHNFDLSYYTSYNLNMSKTFIRKFHTIQFYLCILWTLNTQISNVGWLQ